MTSKLTHQQADTIADTIQRFAFRLHPATYRDHWADLFDRWCATPDLDADRMPRLLAEMTGALVGMNCIALECDDDPLAMAKAIDDALHVIIAGPTGDPSSMRRRHARRFHGVA